MEKKNDGGFTAIRWIALVAVAALAIAAVIGFATGAFRVGKLAGGNGVTINESRTFPAQGVRHVNVQAVSERIHVVTSQDGAFGAHLSGTVMTSRPDSVPRLVASVAGDTLNIEATRNGHLVVGFNFGGDVTLDVSVPASFVEDLSATAVSGEIEIGSHTYGTLNVQTTSGRVGLDKINAQAVTANSVSGEVEANGLVAQQVSVETTSGSVSLQSDSKAVRIRSISGGVEAALATAPTGVEIGTTSGAVLLTLPPASQFLLDASSTSGDVACDFPIALTGAGGAGHKALAGKVGDSANLVTVHTVSGSIRVAK